MKPHRRKTDPKGRTRLQRTESDVDRRRFREQFIRDFPVLREREGLIERLAEPVGSENLHQLEVLALQRAAVLDEAYRYGLSAEQEDALNEALKRIDEQSLSIKRPDHPLRRKTP